MNDNAPDELISAYLDDELSAEERARVERMLAEDAELRQTVDDLRALRASLQSLPRHRLDSSFSERVLREAERAMLASPEGQWPSATSTPRAPQQPMGPSPSASERPPRNWRALGWAGVAAALALLMFVNQRMGQQREIGVAQRDPWMESKETRKEAKNESRTENRPTPAARSSRADTTRSEAPALRAKEEAPAAAAPAAARDVAEAEGMAEDAPVDHLETDRARKDSAAGATGLEKGAVGRSAPVHRAAGAAKAGAAKGGAAGEVMAPKATKSDRVADAKAALGTPSADTAKSTETTGASETPLWVVTAAPTPDVRRELFETLTAQSIEMLEQDKQQAEGVDERLSKKNAQDKSTRDDSIEAIDIEGTPEQAAAVLDLLRRRGAIVSSVALNLPVEQMPTGTFGAPPDPRAEPPAPDGSKSAEQRTLESRRPTPHDTETSQKATSQKAAAASQKPADSGRSPVQPPEPDAPVTEAKGAVRRARVEKSPAENAEAELAPAAEPADRPSTPAQAAMPKEGQTERATGNSRSSRDRSGQQQVRAQQQPQRSTARFLRTEKVPRVDDLAGDLADVVGQKSVSDKRKKDDRKKTDDIGKYTPTLRGSANAPQAPPQRVRVVLLLRPPQ
ncbi:MAG: zf-HC2 domain-containing protein [Pirellulales bacterium]